jgi:hypothetical protein
MGYSSRPESLSIQIPLGKLHGTSVTVELEPIGPTSWFEDEPAEILCSEYYTGIPAGEAVNHPINKTDS